MDYWCRYHRAVADTVRSFITEEAIRGSATNCVPAGTVLLVTRTSVGKVALAAMDLCFSQDITAITPDPQRLDTSYLVRFLQTKQPHLERLARGATIKGVTREAVANLEIPLPPLAEQRRIAEILDRADALRAKRRAALARLDTLTQSIFLEMFGDPATNPKGWATTRLGDLCTRITDGTHQPPIWSETGHPFLFVSNIISGEINFDTQRFISDETHAGLTRRCPIEVGDVLYSTVGSYGVPAVVRTTRKFAFQRHIAHLKPDRGVLEPEFLRVMLASPPLYRQADGVARGVAQKTVNLSDIREFVVFRPSLKTQREFGRHVSRIDSLKTRYKFSLSQLDTLFASLQHRAFRGEL